MPLLRAGRCDEAIELLEEGLRERPGNASILYNLACAESQAGRPLDALVHLRRGRSPRGPSYAEQARRDPDFDAIRGEPGFP